MFEKFYQGIYSVVGLNYGANTELRLPQVEKSLLGWLAVFP